MNMDLYDDTYDLFCKSLEKQNSKILEIGCGPGNVTKYLLAKRPDFKIEAIDFAPNMIELARANNPTANFKILDCREVNTLASKFDGIICGFCIPYLSKKESSKLLKDCSSLLNPNGILYFSAIEGDYQKSGYEKGSTGDKAYVYYYEEDFLLGLLKEINFNLLGLCRKQYPKTPTTFSTDMIFVAKKT
ncbi:MAG: class I SAM-dependent methyltransferase [Chitinophagaceae bacterium]